MSKKEQIFLLAILLSAVFAILAILGWLMLNSHAVDDESAATTKAKSQVSSVLVTATSNVGNMNAVERAATQTKAALLGTVEPSETPAPEALKYWSPTTNSDFMPRFTYDSNRWALSDMGTLASLQTDCIVRMTGGHPLGRGWSTEESNFEAPGITFMVIVAKYEDVPRFATYSTKNGAVFEINSANDFPACQQAGESILKTISLP